MTKERAKELLEMGAGMLEWDFTLEFQEAVKMACEALDKQEETYKYMAIYMTEDVLSSVRIEMPCLPTEKLIRGIEEKIKEEHKLKQRPIIINLIKIQ